MSFKVFISYSTKDLDDVNHVKAVLEESNADVFVAEYSLEPGQQLSAEIVSAIKFCDLFVLIWSSNAQSSEWVPQEIGIAKSEKKAILPVVLEKDLKLPGFISDLKYLAAYQNPENALEWIKTHVFERMEAKKRNDGLFWLGLGAALIYLSR